MRATPQEWADAAAKPWQVFYPFVAAQVKDYLTNSPEYDLTQTMSTDALVGRLVLNWNMPGGKRISPRVYKALNALADHELKDWWQPGVPKSILGGSKQIIPKRWRAPPAERAVGFSPVLAMGYGVSTTIAGAVGEIENFLSDPTEGYVNGISKSHLQRWRDALKRPLPAPEDATATPVQP